MERKKQPTSGPRPGKQAIPLSGHDAGIDPGVEIRPGIRSNAAGDSVDGVWDHLADGDLVELSDLDELSQSGAAAPAGPDPDDQSLAPRSPARGGVHASPLLSRPTIPDLPAPVGPKPTRTAARSSSPMARANPPADLPAPVGPLPRRSIPDLLSPLMPRPAPPTPESTPAPQSVPPPGGPRPVALPPLAPSIPPAPPAPLAASPAAAEDADLLVPVGPVPSRRIPDLVPPIAPAARPSLDLPAPKGFFDDGIQPKANPTPGIGPDLPAPKGFFDDGIQPKASPGGLDLPAPKGFFDDGIQPRVGLGKSQALDGLDLGAPRDPLDAVEPDRPALAALDGDASGLLTFGQLEPSGSIQRPFGLDAASLELERTSESVPPPLSLELNDAPLDAAASAPRTRAPRLELTLSAASDPLDDGAEHAKLPSIASFGVGGDIGLPGSPLSPAGEPRPHVEEEDPFAPSRAAGHLRTTEIKLQVDPTPGMAPLPVSITPKRAPRRDAEARRRAERSPAEKKKRMLIAAAGLAAVALVGAGYAASQWWKGRTERETRSANSLRQVEKLLADDSPAHWEEAAAEARRLQTEDRENAEPIAVVAEASFASALDESSDAAARVKEGDKALGALRQRGAKGPHARKAEALRAILSTNLTQAMKALEELTHAGADGDAALYLGWAQAAAEQHAAAEKSFTAALQRSKTRIPARYGLALSQLELGNDDDAARSFQSVIDHSRDRYKRDHLGALIGLAQLAPVSERESRYQELLARPDLAASPPRAVARLHALAGDEALRAGRLDQARTRYEAAHGLDPLNLRASVGLALVAARSGDLAGARKKLVADVLEVAPAHIEGALALIDVALAANQRDEAATTVDTLLARRPPIANATLLGRVHLARARLYDTAPDPAVQPKAEAEYRAAIERAEPGDFAATVGLSSLLMRLGRKDEAVEVLSSVKAAARSDPALALTLGTAYLAAGQADVAAESFRSVLARRPDDAEAHFQLGRALLALGKTDDAIESLRRAYESDPSREDVGLTLARTLDTTGRTREVVATYKAMLAADRKPSLTVRAQAGRAFARFDMAAEADAQGQAIRAEDPRNSAGLFLEGEAHYRQGKYEEALKAFRDATRSAGEAQYFEALGRASEKLAQYDDALRSFGDAIAADPDYLAPRLGRGRVRLVRREYALAVNELLTAQKIAPDSAPVLRDLGRSYFAMRDLKQAVPYLERSVALDGHDAASHYALGVAYSDLDRAGLSAQHLGRAVELAPPDAPWRAEALRQLGYVQRAAGNRAGATAAWRRYLELDHTDGPQRRDVQRMLLRLEAR